MSTEATITPPAPETTQAAAPAQTATKEAPLKKQATLEHFSDAQIEQRVQDNLDRWLKGEKPKPEEKAPEKVEKPAEEVDGEDVKEPAKAEKKPEKDKAKKEYGQFSADDSEDDGEEPKPRRRKQPVAKEDDDRLEKAVDKLADKITKRQEPAKEGGLSKADAEKRRVFEQMSKDNPDEYAGLPEKFDKFVSQESKYRSKWEKENPGERYNPDDEAHAEFYNKYGIEYDNDHYVDARVELKSNEKLESFTKKQQEQQSRILREQEAAKQAERMTADIPKLLAKEIVGKDLDLDALESEDPAAHHFISRAMEDATTLVSELAILTADPSKLDLKGNRTHQVLLERMEYYESQLSEAPFKDTVIKEGGRTKEFATLEDFQRMNAADQKHYWTVYTHPEQTKKYILRDLGSVVKNDIERQEQLFQQRIAKRNGATSQTTTTKETPKTQPRRESPEVTGGDRRVTPVESNEPKEDDAASRMDKWFGGL